MPIRLFPWEKRSVKKFVKRFCIAAMTVYGAKTVAQFIKMMVDDKIDENAQGEFFEQCIHALFIEEFGYTDINYTKPTPQGLDDILRDKNGFLRDEKGDLVVFEIKSFDHQPSPEDLKKTKRFGRQGGRMYIFFQAMKMLVPGLKINTPENVKIAREILSNLEDVRSLLIATNISEMLTTVYERKGSKWEKLGEIKLLDIEKCPDC